MLINSETFKIKLREYLCRIHDDYGYYCPVDPTENCPSHTDVIRILPLTDEYPKDHPEEVENDKCLNWHTR